MARQHDQKNRKTRTLAVHAGEAPDPVTPGIGSQHRDVDHIRAGRASRFFCL